MNETILRALMNLFALVADVDDEGITTKSRNIVESYLKGLLNSELTAYYINLFNEYVAFHHRDISGKDSIKAKKRTTLNAIKVLQICDQINNELTQEQKVLVLFQLLEYINDGDTSEMEKEFVKTVSESFYIDDDEFSNCEAFIMKSLDKIPDKQQLLIINHHKDSSESQIKHIFNENLEGKIVILQVKSTKMYFFRYLGKEALYQNTINIVPGKVYVMNNGSTIRGSKINPIYFSDIVGKFIQEKEAAKIIFTANHVEFRFKNSSTGIQDFCFSEESGQLIGIMGGSGVGKSTLLNVLNGNLNPQSGIITINDLDIHKNKNEIQGLIGFVPQDDLLIEELTVYQNLYYNAKLCFDDFTKEQIEKAVTVVLDDLDLTSIRDLVVGNPLNKTISGGQRKRLNIALELIREPFVMFVDEPTSGLSSNDSEMVMDLLKELTLKGKLIIVNIHQPSSVIYKMFDKLIIMDKGGYQVFYGNPIDAIVYFKTMSNYVDAANSECDSCGNVNPEQVLQILEAKVVNEYGKLTKNRKVSPAEWTERYRENVPFNIKNIENKDLPKNNFKIPNFFQQFRIFVTRDVLAKITNKQYLAISMLEAPLLAALLGFFTKYISGIPGNPNAYVFMENDNLPAFLFMSMVVALFFGMTISAEEIIKDRRIRQREAFLNLSRISYLNSKVILMFIISAIQTISYVLIGNWMLGIKGMTLSYFLVLFTTACSANLIGLNISSALNSVVTIYILIPFILVPQLLFSGVIVKFDKLNKKIASQENVSVIGDLMLSRWAYEAIAVDQFKNNDYQKNFFDINQWMSYYSYRYNLLKPILEGKLNESVSNITNNVNTTKVTNDLKILRNEISKLTYEFPIIKYNYIDSLYPKSLTSLVIEVTQQYLNDIEHYCIKKYNKLSDKKDKLLLQLDNQLKDKGSSIDKLKSDYYNNNLADLTLNRIDLVQVYEGKDKLIQKKDPIYKIPESKYGRAQFYAAYKRIGTYIINTYWFDIGVIWIASLMLYLALLFDLLKKSMDWFSNLKLLQEKKK